MVKRPKGRFIAERMKVFEPEKPDVSSGKSAPNKPISAVLQDSSIGTLEKKAAPVESKQLTETQKLAIEHAKERALKFTKTSDSAQSAPASYEAPKSETVPSSLNAPQARSKNPVSSDDNYAFYENAYFKMKVLACFVAFFFILLFLSILVYVLVVKAFYWGDKKGPPTKKH